MIGLKRLIRPGVVISVIGHVAALMLGLSFVGASSFKSVPQDAMVVDIVPPDEAPRYSGTPSELRSSGSEVAEQSANVSAAQPPPKRSTQSPQQERQRATMQHDARQAAAQPQPTRAETTQAEIASEAPPAPAEPQPEETPDQTTTAETFAELALIGGRLGGGFAAPPIGTVQQGYDFTLMFRERVSSCSSMPPGMDTSDRTSVTLRVAFNRDGTLASTPQALSPIASPKEVALMQSAIEALEKCQPYTMLPANRYKDWKSIDLTFFPMNFLGG
jgi:hypothetical protein